VQDHTKIIVWHRARALTLLVRDASRRIRTREAPGLRAQLMDAVQSIATNIAEGAGRSTRPDFARFIDVATASTTEVEHHLTVAHDFGMIDDALLARAVAATIEVRRMLFGFRKSLLRYEAEEREKLYVLRQRARRRPRGSGNDVPPPG
jgi:four helix bundle protein